MSPRRPDASLPETARELLAAGGLDVWRALAFYTRLPLPLPPAGGTGALSRALGAGPLAGLAVGAVAGLVFALAAALGLPTLAAAALAVAAGLLVTGGLHEDGLADVADAFGGSFERARKLEILHDSHVGTYGVAAVALSVLLRAAALAALPGSLAAITALLAAHAASRAAPPLLMHWMSPARRDGLAAGTGRPPAGAVLAAGLLAVVVTLPALGWAAGLAGLITGGLAAAAVGRLAQVQIGGYTGDVLGAAQQAAEVAVLLAAAAIIS